MQGPLGFALDLYKLNLHAVLHLPPEAMGAWLTIIDSADLRPALAGSRVPTLFITGAHDKVVAPAQAREITRCMPRSSYHEYADSGHIPILEQEAECFENLRLWLRAN